MLEQIETARDTGDMGELLQYEELVKEAIDTIHTSMCHDGKNPTLTAELDIYNTTLYAIYEAKNVVGSNL